MLKGLTAKTFVTPEYIAGVISTGKWCEHGSCLSRFIEEVASDHLPEHLLDTSYDDIIKSDEFAEFLPTWMNKRFAWCKKYIKEDLNTAQDHNGLFTLSRTIYCTPELLERIKEKDIDIGRYWTTSGYYSYAHNTDKDRNTLQVTVTASVNAKDIDFMQTLISRMDYSNGDDEMEIYIKPTGSPVFLSISVTTTDDEYLGEIDCSTPEREKALLRKQRHIQSELAL